MKSQYRFILASVITLVVLVPQISPVLAEDCRGWLSGGYLEVEEFWKSANRSDVEYCLAQGHTVFERDNYGYTPLHRAAGKNRNTEIFETLLRHGAKVDARTKNGATAFYIAASSNNPEVLDLLLRHGANVNARYENGNIPLHIAALNNTDPVTIDLLLSNGAEINAQNKWGHTPYHWAARNNSKETLDILLSYGANVDLRTNDGLLPVHFAARSNENPETLVYLIHKGVDVNARDKYGLTPLHYAAQNNKPIIVKILLDSKAEPSTTDFTGRFAFDMITEESPIYGTDIYWHLNDARHQ